MKSEVETLLIRVMAGDREAFSRLFERFRPRLEEVVRARLGGRLRREADRDDVVQETFVRALRAVGDFQYRGEGSFFRWLKTIAERVVLEAASRRKRWSTVELDRDVPAGGDSPSKVFRRKERIGRLERALDTLTPDYRKVIVLARIRGVPIKLIAERMNRSPGAVSQLLLRALEKLRSALDGKGDGGRSLIDSDTG